MNPHCALGCSPITILITFCSERKGVATLEAVSSLFFNKPCLHTSNIRQIMTHRYNTKPLEPGYIGSFKRFFPYQTIPAVLSVIGKKNTHLNARCLSKTFWVVFLKKYIGKQHLLGKTARKSFQCGQTLISSYYINVSLPCLLGPLNAFWYPSPIFS